MTDQTRPATPADEDAILAIIHATEMFTPDEVDDLHDMLRSDLTADADRRWFVRAAGGLPRGAATLARDGFARDVDNLLFLGVLPADRGRGVARALVAEAERRARRRGARLLLIETSSRPQFAPARALYGGLGYVLDGAIRDYHAPGDDKLVYRKTL